MGEREAEDPGSFDLSKQPLVVAGIVAVIVVIGVSLGGGDDPGILTAEPPTTVASSTSTATSTASPGDSPHNPDVPPINCHSVLTNKDIAKALNVWDRPGGAATTFGLSQGETCGEFIDGEEDSFVRLEPGGPSDFESGTTHLGSASEAVAEVGDGAVWYRGSGDDAHAGLLAVREETSLGVLHFRVALGRPELSDAERLAVAVDLARSILPRFPGVEVEPDLIEFEEGSAIDTDRSLSGLLYGKVESGEWLLGEGLLVVLDWMVNGTEGVVPGPFTDSSATAVIAAATAYVAGESEDAEQVRGLLDRLTPSLEVLEQMSTPPEVAEGESSDAGATNPVAPYASDEAAVLRSPASSVFFGGGPAPNPCDEYAVESPCLEKVALPDDTGLEPGKYSLYAALSETSVWSIEDVEVAKKALVESAIIYEALGSMPETALVLRPGGESLYAHYLPGKDCRVYVDEFLAGTNQTELEQILAREIAFCLIANDFFLQFYKNPNPTRWLAYGLANYLSGVVYPSNNLEHKNLPDQLAQSELSTTVDQRSWTNWIVFEHFHSFIGPDLVAEMVRSLPEGGDLVAALAGAAGVREMFHDLGRGLSDATVEDVGAGTVPYSPQAWELNLSGPAEVPLTVPRFGVRRLHIKVPPGDYACVDSFTQGEMLLSWRPGAPGGSGLWSDELPFAFEGESVLLLTSVEPGAHFTLDVTDVDDDPDCSDEEDGSDADDCNLGIICDPSGFFYRVIAGD